MINKIVIANRGEIAVRLVRACTEMDITSVAVYADADRNALHVKKADEAYCLGPDPVSGYLNAHRLVNVALASGCDAIHPGYGFFSENPAFVEACNAMDIIFIGPSAEVINEMGNKSNAREKAMVAAEAFPVLGSITSALIISSDTSFCIRPIISSVVSNLRSSS